MLELSTARPARPTAPTFRRGRPVRPGGPQHADASPTAPQPDPTPHNARRHDTRPAAGVLEAVGDTPTVPLRRMTCGRALRVFAKLEFCNPGGSMKDRPALRMVRRALADGRLRAGMTVVESSSGNMAVGLAQACAAMGLDFLCVADVRTQEANLDLVRAYGGRVEVIREPDPQTGDFLTARLNRVRAIVEECPGVFWTNQYANPENPAAHEAGTVRQLLRDSGGLDVLLIATSTTGTLNGALDCCAKHSPHTRVVAVDAAGSVLFGGQAGPRRISGLGAGMHTPLSKGASPAAVERVGDLDCVVGCRALVKLEGVLAGGSSGGLAVALSRLAGGLDLGTRVGLVLPDHGSRYLGTVYSDPWVADACGLNTAELGDRVRGAVTELGR